MDEWDDVVLNLVEFLYVFLQTIPQVREKNRRKLSFEVKNLSLENITLV